MGGLGGDLWGDRGFEGRRPRRPIKKNYLKFLVKKENISLLKPFKESVLTTSLTIPTERHF